MAAPALCWPAVLLRHCVASARDGDEALRTVCRAAAVCSSLRRAACDESVWQALALRLWPSARALLDAPPPRGWRAFVRARTLAQRRFEAQPLRHVAPAWQLSDFSLVLDVHDAATLFGAPLVSLALPLNPDALLLAPHGGQANVCEAALPACVATWPQVVRVRLLALRSDGALAIVLQDEVTRDEETRDEVPVYKAEASLMYRSQLSGNARYAQITVHAQGSDVTVRARGRYADDEYPDDDDVGLHMSAAELVEALSEQLLWVRQRELPLQRPRLLRSASVEPTGAEGGAVAAVLSQPALLSMVLSCLPPRDIGAAALTCVAFAAAARGDEMWHTAMQRFHSPALAAFMATAGTATPPCWRALCTQLDAVQRRLTVLETLQSRGGNRFFDRRTGHRYRSEPEDSGSDTSPDASPRIDCLQDFVFLIDVVHVPANADDADALSPATQWTRLCSAACTMPVCDSDGEVGSGLHFATASNVLLDSIDAAAAAVEDSYDWDAEYYVPPALDPHGEFCRETEWWLKSLDKYNMYDSPRIMATMAVLRRTDGAVAVLSTPARSRLGICDFYEGYEWIWEAPVGDFARYRKGTNICSVSARLNLDFVYPDTVDAIGGHHMWACSCPAYGFPAVSLSWDVSASALYRDFVWDKWDSLSEDVSAMLCLLDWQEA